MKKGKLISNGVHLQAHEFHTVRLLIESGYNVELIPAANIKGMQIPDIMIDTIPWEIKAPQGGGRHTIKHNLQNAAHQSENVIIDLYRSRMDEGTALREIKHHFMLSKRIKRLKVVKKNGEILDF